MRGLTRLFSRGPGAGRSPQEWRGGVHDRRRATGPESGTDTVSCQEQLLRCPWELVRGQLCSQRDNDECLASFRPLSGVVLFNFATEECHSSARGEVQLDIWRGRPGIFPSDLLTQRHINATTKPEQTPSTSKFDSGHVRGEFRYSFFHAQRQSLRFQAIIVGPPCISRPSMHNDERSRAICKLSMHTNPESLNPIARRTFHLASNSSRLHWLMEAFESPITQISYPLVCADRCRK